MGTGIQDQEMTVELAMKYYLLSWGLIVLSSLFDSYAAFVVKLKFNQLGPMDLSSFRGFFAYILKFMKSPLLVSAMVAFFLAPGLWFIALERVDLSVGYPAIVGFHLVFALIFGVVFLGEAMTIAKGVGIALALSSLFFLFKPT